jgi:acetyltransferase-like isoleucine patch superfamily enzyme/dTDP-4-dehydrorhamnose 3,5-epimerase-like enzyme
MKKNSTKKNLDKDIYIHPNAIVESKNIGKNTRIWAFAHILPEAVIGEDCNICDHTFIENDVKIGNRTTIKSGVQLWDGLRIKDDVFVGPNATFTNDPFPRSKQRPEYYPRTIIHNGASIGANATILPGIEIGRNAMVGAGAVVTKSVPPHAIVIGNPARIMGYEPRTKSLSLPKAETVEPQEVKILNVGGAKIFGLPLIKDLRGSLSYAQYTDNLPFLPKRYFLVYDVPSKEVRGEHAHRNLHQFLICIYGNCAIVVDDGQNRAEIELNHPNIGLYIPPMVWSIQYKFSKDAVLLVLASDIYEADDYIRDYEEFISLVL